jgi:hypothetical protein
MRPTAVPHLTNVECTRALSVRLAGAVGLRGMKETDGAQTAADFRDVPLAPPDRGR